MATPDIWEIITEYLFIPFRRNPEFGTTAVKSAIKSELKNIIVPLDNATVPVVIFIPTLPHEYVYAIDPFAFCESMTKKDESGNTSPLLLAFASSCVFSYRHQNYYDISRTNFKMSHHAEELFNFIRHAYKNKYGSGNKLNVIDAVGKFKEKADALAYNVMKTGEEIRFSYTLKQNMAESRTDVMILIAWFSSPAWIAGAINVGGSSATIASNLMTLQNLLKVTNYSIKALKAIKALGKSHEAADATYGAVGAVIEGWDDPSKTAWDLTVDATFGAAGGLAMGKIGRQAPGPWSGGGAALAGGTVVSEVKDKLRGTPRDTKESARTEAYLKQLFVREYVYLMMDILSAPFVTQVKNTLMIRDPNQGFYLGSISY